MRLRLVIVGLLLGIAVATVGWLIFIVVMARRDGMPLMTADELTAATKRWHDHRVENYDLDLDVKVILDGKVHVEVRGGEVTKMTRDGIETAATTWPYWSVDGLLGVMQRDVETNQKLSDPEAATTLQAVFDKERGLPRRYRRTPVKGGLVGQWEITSFKEAPAKTP